MYSPSGVGFPVPGTAYHLPSSGPADQTQMNPVVRGSEDKCDQQVNPASHFMIP